MESTVRLALLGDHDEGRRTHAALDEALSHAVGARHCAAVWDWVGTETLAIEPVSVLGGAHAIIAATDECVNVEGALAGIRIARERGIPFLAVGGAFRHTLLEFGRNVLGLDLPLELEAATEESSSGHEGEARRRRSGAFFLQTESRTAALYGRWRAVEETPTEARVDSALLAAAEAAGLRVTGTDSAGGPTVVELASHPFFIAALFEPQLASRPLAPAPLIRAVVDAAIHDRDGRGTPHGVQTVAAGG